MDAIDILEKRIDSLTRMLSPNTESSKSISSVTTEKIVDSLLSAHTLLTDATKGRDLIDKAVNRAPELEIYLDPNFLEQNNQVRSKVVYLNAVAPELRSQFEQLNEIKKLECTLGAEYFRNIPSESTKKLQQVAEDNSEFAQQAELIEESLILAMKRYGEIQSSLLESLGAMNKRLEAVEEKLQQKKHLEREKDMMSNGDK